jgi:hypothetical protein
LIRGARRTPPDSCAAPGMADVGSARIDRINRPAMVNSDAEITNYSLSTDSDSVSPLVPAIGSASRRSPTTRGAPSARVQDHRRGPVVEIVVDPSDETIRAPRSTASVPKSPHRLRPLDGQHCPARGPPLIRLGPVLPETAVALLTAQHSSRIGIQAGDGGHGRQSIVSQQRRARSAQTEPAFRSQLTPMVRRLCHGSLFRRRPARGRGEGRAVAQSTERPSADL